MLTDFLIVSDVHANTEALRAVLEQAEGMEVFFVGDLVDYGAEPNEVIARLKDVGARGVLGNHDHAALTGDPSGFNPSAAVSSHWTRKALTKESTGYLRGLPRELRADLGGTRFYFAHGSPDDPLDEYVDPATHHLLFGHYLEKVGVPIIGLGHTHVPYVWREAGGTVFNPGSVGQPRDGDPRASYAVFDSASGAVEVRRVEYDVAGAAAKVRAAGLPDSSANRLFRGL